MAKFVIINTVNGLGITEDFVLHREGCADIKKFVKKNRLHRSQVELISAVNADVAMAEYMADDFDGEQTLAQAGFTSRIMPCARSDRKNCTCASDMASDSKLDADGHLPDCRSR